MPELPPLPPLPIPGIGTALNVAGAINKVAQGDFKSLLFPTSGISKFTGKRSERDLIGGDLNPTDALKGIISLSGPFNVDSFRDQASFLANDSSEINRVGQSTIRQLNFLGLNDDATQLNTILRRMFSGSGGNSSNQAALTAVASVKTALNQQLGEPGVTFRGLKGADILDEFNRFDIISSIQGTKGLSEARMFAAQRRQQATIGEIGDPAEFGPLSPENLELQRVLDKKVNDFTNRLNSARSGLRGFLDPGFKFPQPGDPDVGQQPQRKQPNDKGQLARTALRAARLFIRPRLPKQPGFQTGGFVSRASSLGGSSGDIFELEKEEDRIIPSGFISKQATTENRALALNSLR